MIWTELIEQSIKDIIESIAHCDFKDLKPDTI
jgi:hypothetical protein